MNIPKASKLILLFSWGLLCSRAQDPKLPSWKTFGQLLVNFQAVPWWEDIKGPQKGDPSTRLPERTIVHSRPNGLVSNFKNHPNPFKSHDLETFSFGLFLILHPKWQPLEEAAALSVDSAEGKAYIALLGCEGWMWLVGTPYDTCWNIVYLCAVHIYLIIQKPNKNQIYIIIHYSIL